LKKKRNKKILVGFTDNYIKVETDYNESLENKIVTVKLESILPNGNVWAKVI